MDRNSQLANYSLPGVMHYLQSEWSRNQRDRIQWENERSEMKSHIAKLTKENSDLKKELQRNTANSGAHFANSQKPNGNVSKSEVEVLVRAREYLNKTMHEVMFILKNQDQDLDAKEDLLLGLKQDRPYGIERKRPAGGVEQPAPVDSAEEEEISKQLKDTLSVLDKEPQGPLQQEEVPIDVETDLETIQGDDDNDKNSYFADEEPLVKRTASNPRTAFILSAHFDQINQIQVRGDHILTASADGLIQLWNYSAYILNPATTTYSTPQKTFHHDGEIISLRWLSDKNFVTVGKNFVVRIWQIDSSQQTYVLKNKFTNFKNFDAVDYSGGVLVVNDDKGVHIIRLNLDAKGHATPEDVTNPEKIDGDHVVIEGKTSVLVLHKDNVIRIDLGSGKEQTRILLKDIDFEGKNVLQFKIFGAKYWGFVTDDQVIVYNFKDKKVEFLKNVAVSNANFFKDKLILFFSNGDIEIFKKDPKTDSFTKHFKFNHYESIFDVNWDELSNDERDVLTHSKNIGEAFKNGDYILSGGEDPSIRCFHI